MGKVATVDTVGELRAAVAAWRRAGERVALVPTMGALHAGHLSLVERARAQAERVVVSIFVNPTQFAPNEDFSKYPRTLDDDRAQLAGLAELAYTPRVEEMYRPGFATTVSLAGPATAGLEDAFRPTHFAGVATVVAKLLLQALPDVAVFGEKDYQQLKVIACMARDLDLMAEIVGAPTVREADGLALSSRNRYLSHGERAVAPVLHLTLQDCVARLRAGEAAEAVLAAGIESLTAAGFAVDYLALREADTLAPLAGLDDGSGRLLVAAKLGQTRLIDNIAA